MIFGTICLHDQLCWQTDLPVCLPAQVRSCRSQWQACVTLYAPGTIHMWLWYISSSFVVHKFKMMISPGFFFKILIFLVGRRSKGKKWPKLTKNSVCCCALCLRNHTSEGLIQRFLGGSSSMKNNGHNCDQALIKNSWESV